MGWLQSPLGLLLVGAIAGTASGLFGIGGGLIMVPIFLFVLNMEPHKATATSLAVVVLPVALPAVIRFYKAGNVDLRVAAWIAVGFAVASLLGAKLNLSLSSVGLKRAFAVLLLYSAFQLIRSTMPKRPAVQPPASSGQAQKL